MNNKSDEIIKCSFCKKEIKPFDYSEWSDGQGDVLFIPEYEKIYTLIEIDNCEYYMCEECYKVIPINNSSKDVQFDIHFEFGIEYSQKKQFTNSIEVYERASKIKNSGELLRHLAQVYGLLGQKEKELSLMREAYKINNKNYLVLVEFAGCLNKNQSYFEALKIIDESLMIKSDSDIAYMIKAEALYKLGSKKEAYKYFEDALAINQCPCCIKSNNEWWQEIITS